MWQDWVNTTGLALDFLGVLLLSYEWWLALKASEREAEIEQREQWHATVTTQHANNPNLRNNPSLETFERMKKKMNFDARQRRGFEVRGIRRGYFTLAFVLIASGFMLQIIGSLPL